MAGEGAKLGVARGIIELVTDRFQRSAQVIQSTSRQVSKDVEGIGTSADTASKKATSALGRIAEGFQRAQKAAQVFDKTPLGTIQKGLDAIKQKFAGISAAGAGLATLGLATSNNIRKAELQMTALLGSSEKTAKELKRLRDFADEMRVPYTKVLEAAAALTPLVKSSGAEASKLLLITQKLATIDPAQGVTGARIALSEFMSGDITSIFRRFELGVGRDTFREAFQSANGDTNKMLDNLEKILDTTGLTTEAVKQMSDPFAVLVDEGKLALDTAFRPLLTDVVIPLVQQLTGFLRNLRETNPELLKIGAGVTLIVAALYPLTTIVTSLIGLWKGVAAAAALAGKNMTAAGAAGVVGKLAVGAGAVAVGAGIGQKVATGLADQGIGDPRLRSDSKENFWDVLGERVKQIVVILANVVVDIAGILMKGVAFWLNAIDQVVNAFKFLGTFLSEFGGNLQKVLGQLILGLGQFLKSIPGQEEAGRNLVTSGVQTLGAGALQVGAAQRDRLRLADRLAEGFAVPQSTLDEIDSRINGVRSVLIGGLTNMLFPVQKAAEETAQGLGDAGDKVAGAMPPGDSEEFLADQAAEITDAVKQYNDDILKINDERHRAEAEANQQFADDQVKIAQEAVEASQDALEKLIEDRNRLNTAFLRDGEKAERDRQRKILEEQIKAQRQEVKENQDHAAKLADMRDKQRRDEQEALLDFDFRKLFEMSLDNAGTLSKENDDFAKQREARNQAIAYELEDIERHFQQEREERLIKFNQDLSDRSEQYQKETQQIAEQTVAKQVALQQAHAAELQQIQTKHQTELQLRQQAMQQELSFLMMSEQQRNQFLLNEQSKYMNQAVQLAQQFGIKMSQALQVRAAAQPVRAATGILTNVGQRVGTAVGNVVSNVGTSIGNVLNNAMQTATGGGSSTPNTGAGTGGFNMVRRAFGGPLLAGQPALVNDQFRGQVEQYRSGTAMYALPGGMGMFQPFKPGRIDPGTGSSARREAPTISMPITIYGNVDENMLAKLERMMDEKIAQMMEAFE